MKVKSMIFLIAVTVLFAWACSFQDSFEELATGKYVMQNAEDDDWSWILLEENNKFEFNLANNVSYRPSGIYSVENHELLLKVSDDEHYRFAIKGKTLIFKGIKSGKNAERMIDSEIVFELTNNK